MIENIGSKENRKRDLALKQFIHEIERLDIMSDFERMYTLYRISKTEDFLFDPENRINEINNLKRLLKLINDEYSFNTDKSFLEELTKEITLQELVNFVREKENKECLNNIPVK